MARQSGPSRWVPARQIAQRLKEPRICRPLASRARNWSRPHYLGVFAFENCVTRLRRSVLLDFNLSARLCFGFDQLLGMLRAVSITIARDTCILDMRFRLPAPENKIKALGWSATEPTNSNHQLTFHVLSLPILKATLNRLAIKQNIAERNRCP